MDVIDRSILLPASVSEVWAALTQPERLSAWFGATAVEVELRPGGRITFHQGDAVMRGLVEVVEPSRRFAFRWLAQGGASEERTRVEFTLTETTRGTRLTVRERPLWEGPLWEDPGGRPADLAVSGVVR
jgi:uncharacterized protein YndB with AHSA1/START domain